MIWIISALKQNTLCCLNRGCLINNQCEMLKQVQHDVYVFTEAQIIFKAPPALNQQFTSVF